jgi:hypothetical protein
MRTAIVSPSTTYATRGFFVGRRGMNSADADDTVAQTVTRRAVKIRIIAHGA